MSKDFGGATAGYANVSLPTKSDEEKALDLTMRALAKDRYSVHERGDLAKPERSATAQLPSNGWRNPLPLEVPGGARAQILIEKMLPATAKERREASAGTSKQTQGEKIAELKEKAEKRYREQEALWDQVDAGEQVETSAGNTKPKAGLARRKL
jgi:hypothetical protein